jgi:hypothetical protein
MAGRPRLPRLSAEDVERGTVDIDGAARQYSFYPQSSTIKFSPGYGSKAQGTCMLKNGDVADEATITKRIRAALDRAAEKAQEALASAIAPAPTIELSPFHTRGPGKRRLVDPLNVGRDDVPPSFPTSRPKRWCRDAATTRRKLVVEEEELFLQEAVELGDKLLRLRELKADAAARARSAETNLERLVNKHHKEKEKRSSLESELSTARTIADGLKDEVKRLQTELEETSRDALAKEKLEQVPTFGMVGKGTGRGRGRVWPWWLRVMIYEQLVNGTRPSAVVKNIVSDAAYLVPWLEVYTPTTRSVRRMRYELRLVGKAIAAYRVARAIRIMTLGSDGTEKLQVSLLTSNVQIETKDGAEDVILEAAYVTRGKTAEIEVGEVAASCFERGRAALAAWIKIHCELFPNDPLGLFPDPAEFGLHRAAGGCLIQGDTCAQANKFKSLMQEAIATALEEHDPNWSSYDEKTKAEKMRTHQGDCWNHLRNIWFGAGANAIAAKVKEGLADDLANFSSFERVSSEVMALVRAVYKEFHQSGDYAKGKGKKDYRVWLLKEHPTIFYMNESRAKGGPVTCRSAYVFFLQRPFPSERVGPYCLSRRETPESGANSNQSGKRFSVANVL